MDEMDNIMSISSIAANLLSFSSYLLSLPYLFHC